MNKYLHNLINIHEYKIGLEVGVRHGDNCRNILNNTNLEKLYGIDIRYDEKAAQFKNVNNKFIYLIDKSPECTNRFSDNFFDFIYIDAGHSYNEVKSDLIAWYPKVRTGGLFCGDDYLYCDNPTEGWYAVPDAVEEFCTAINKEPKINDYENFSLYNRKDFAIKWGKASSDNLYLAHEYLVGKEACKGRVRTENIPMAFWWFIK